MSQFRFGLLATSSAVLVAACGTTVPGVDPGSAPGGAATSMTGQPTTGSLGGSTAGGGGHAPGGGAGPTVPTTAQDGTAGQGSSAGSRTTGTATPGGADGVGASAPIEIGLLVTETGSYAKGTGVSLSASDLERKAVHAYVNSINATGGVGGRKIKLIEASVEFTAPDLNSQYQAACARFTQDNHVGAVIYDGAAYIQSLNLCLTRAGVPTFYMGMGFGTMVGDDTDFANHPGLIAFNSASTDRRIKSMLNKALSAGFLDRGSKLGVFVEDCPYNIRAYVRTLTPILTRANVSVDRQDTRCLQSSSDQGTTLAELQAAVLRWKTADVDTVMFVTSFENGYIYYFAQGAEQQQYRPQYLLFHQQGAREAMAVFPREQLVKMRGFGGMPLAEVTHPPAPTPAQAAVRKSCLSIARGSGLAGTDTASLFTIFNACDAVSLLRRSLTVSGGRTGTKDIVAAIERIGTDFVSALSMNGATSFRPGRHDGMQLTAVSVYQSKCQCFGYITPPSPLT